jgi:O-succinylhomoserine sulfhydrylase
MNAAQSGFGLSRRGIAPDVGPVRRSRRRLTEKTVVLFAERRYERIMFSAAENHPETRLVHEGALRSEFGETSETLYLTQGFTYASAESAEARFLNEEPGYSYSRFSNPTVAMFEERMAGLEGAEAARATASGMAAVTAALMGQVRAGDHVVAARALFGSCRWVVEDLLPQFGVPCTLVDGPNLAEWRQAVRPETRTFFLESPANPTLEVIDIAGVARIAHEAGATLIVDNVFATPLFQRPLALGADCVVYSATKHIDGQGRCLGGIILASQDFIETKVQQFLRMTGPTLSPFNAWVLLKGLETLPLRVERQTRTASALADALHDHPKLARLTYPGRPDHLQAELIARQMSGPSTMLALDLAGGKEAAFRFMNALRIVKISNNLGDAKSLVTHPATTTHQRFAPYLRAQMGISEGLVRLSVGLEHPDDLLRDLARALDAA